VNGQAYVVIDVGKSGTRIKIHPWAEVLVGPGAAPELAGGPEAGRYLADLLAATWSQSGADGSGMSAVVIGSTFLPPTKEQEACRAALRQIWPSAVITLVSDGVLAHAAMLGGAGTVASLGTGTSVVGMDRSRHLHQMDSWGPDLGDRGSAADLGRSALRLACATVDGVAQTPGLLRMACDWLGEELDTPAAARLLAAEDRAARLADFALVICRGADDGDTDAAALVQRSARKVADTCTAMAARIGNPTLVLRGRFATDPSFHAALIPTLRAQGLTLIANNRDVLDIVPDVIADSAYRRTPQRATGGTTDLTTTALQEF
jgi:N-acetylglucosamine kinase-like BadF-type ATPase